MRAVKDSLPFPMEKVKNQKASLDVRNRTGSLYEPRDLTSLGLDQRFRKALSPPYSSPLRLTQAKSSQELGKKRTLAGVGLSELE